ncbi:MAG: cell division protein FtsA [Bacteroidota bacterium]
MQSEIVVGLDIGTTKIAAIAGCRNEFGKIEVLGYGHTESIGVRRGVITNIENTVNSIQTAIREAQANSKVTIRTVNVGIAGQHIRSIQHRASTIRHNPEIEISQEDIDQFTSSIYNIAMNPGEKIIDVLPQEFTIDGESGVKDPKGMLGHQMGASFHIVTAQTSAAQNIMKCIEKSGYNLQHMILQPLASAEAVLNNDEKEAGVVLVDIGGGTTDVAIFLDGIIRHTAVIPFGGEIITEDIKAGCSIIKKHAEDLKVKFGSALASENKAEEVVAIPGLRGRAPKEITLKNLAKIIQARMEEIIEAVYQEIKSTGLEKRLIAGIVLTGGGAKLKHIEQLTQFITGMDTRIGYPNEHLAGNSVEDITSPMYSTGIGLVLLGMQRTDLSSITNGGSSPETSIEPEKITTPKHNKVSDWFDRFFRDGIS